MKSFILFLLMILLFLAQTAFPNSIHIFGVTINLLVAYIIFLSFTLPTNRSIWYFVFTLIIFNFSASNNWLTVNIPLIYIYYISNYIHTKQITSTISFLYLLLALIGYQIIFVIFAYITGDLLFSNIWMYIIKIGLVDLLSVYIISIFFILAIGRLLSPSRQKLILE